MRETAYRKFEFVCTDTDCDSLIEITTKKDLTNHDQECVCGSTTTLIGSNNAMINTANWDYFKCAWVPCSKPIPMSKTGIVLEYWSPKIKGSYCSEECVKLAQDYTDNLVSV